MIPYSPEAPSPKSPFTRNQHLIWEHELGREKEDIRDHFRRQIDEVEERKRKRLRVALHPDPDIEPRPIPLDPALKVTIAFKPGDLQFSLMGESSTSQLRRGFFEAEHYWSSVTSLG